MNHCTTHDCATRGDRCRRGLRWGEACDVSTGCQEDAPRRPGRGEGEEPSPLPGRERVPLTEADHREWTACYGPWEAVVAKRYGEDGDG